MKMKNLDLNGLGVQEMNAEEMRGLEGGFILEALVLGFFIGALLACIID